MQPISQLLRVLFVIGCFGAAAGASLAAPETTPSKPTARIAPAELSADANGSAILTTSAPGRYSIRVKSPSGARIELVDMIEGPTDSAGAPGQRDGRIDALLDKGAYKIRVTNPKGATGKLRLSAEPFAELNAQKPRLAPTQTQSGDLGDLQQRSYALEIGPEGSVSLEAIGRALADLRLWRESGELVDLSFEKRNVETKPGRAMTRIRLDGALAPGRYVVTAYGGEGVAWSEGDRAQPFFLRIAEPTPLDAGLAEGALGPFGVARFTAQPRYDAFRLEAPQPTPLQLDARRSGGGSFSGEIAKNSREPSATVIAPGDGSQPTTLEVSGYEGQVFSLRAVQRETSFTFEASGPHLVGVDVAGEGGDEVPATVLYARVEKDGKTRVLASDMPRIANAKPWRAKFNIRGSTSLFFEATEAGPVAVDAKGVKLRASIVPVLANEAPRADGDLPSKYDLEPGFYNLMLIPQDGAVGVADVTIGTPGVAGTPLAPRPARQTISFGEQRPGKLENYLIVANVAPSLLIGPRIIRLPADLAKAPAPLWQGASETMKLPVRVAKDGKIVAHDSKGADVAFTLGAVATQDGVEVATLQIAPSGKDRALGLAFVPDPATAQRKADEAKDVKGEKKSKAAENDESESAAEEKTDEKKPATSKQPKAGRAALTMTPGKPIYFDLGQDATQEVKFEAGEGGLYRIETLGRLQTKVKIGAAVAANLGEGENDGPGHNGLVTTYLRAGAYRVAVTAKDSSGRVGLSVTKAALVETPKLVDDGVVRATLAPGKGAATPLEATHEGSYTIDLLGVGRLWQARLEDSEGWPLAKPATTRTLTQRFDKGAYRLVVAPQDVEARMVARLRYDAPATELSGHGPHPLPFETTQKLQWREPQARAAAREPDVWRFALAGDGEITLTLSEGMVGEIIRGEKENVGKFAAGRDFKGKLGAGDYRIEARAISRDDRLDYEISLSSKELQPDTPLFVELPVRLNFALARERLVDLTSFGDKPMLATLKNAQGEIVEQTAGRAEDWNVALTRRLPAGAYRLELQPLGVNPPEAIAENEDEAETDEAGTAEEGGEGRANDADKGIELRLALPSEKDEGALPSINAKTFAGKEAHVLTLPAASAGTLALLTARSAEELALSIERQGADGAWSVVGARRGLSPFAAWPAAETDNGAWRAVVWSVDGGAAPIEVAFRAVERAARRPGEIAMTPVANAPVAPCVGLVALPGASVVEISDAPQGLVAGAADGRLLEPQRDGALAPQSKDVWLAAPGDCKASPAVKTIDWRGEEILLDIAPGVRAELPRLDAPRGKVRVWIARSDEGPVGLDAGRGMAVASGATAALAADKPLTMRNGGGAGALRVAVRAVDVSVAPAAAATSAYRGEIAPFTAQPLVIETGDAALVVELPAEVAAFSSPSETPSVALYGGANSLAATHSGASGKTVGLWLVNLSDRAAPVYVAASGPRESIAPSHVVSRFYGAAGELVLPVDSAKGDVLNSLGGAARFVSQSGAINEGASIVVDGPGVAIVDHAPGLAALWLERGGKTPWPDATAKPVTPPRRVTLEGRAMRFALHQDAPVLLAARSGAPAIVAVTQNGRRDLAAFAEGVELRRYLAPGDATLDVHAPNDGALSGSLDISTSPVIAAHEGINPAATLAPGGAAVFSFEVERESEIGLGLRAEPDRAGLRLMTLAGETLGEGVAQSKKLAPGRYLVEARIPPDAPMTVVRLAIFGLSPPPATPPEEVVAEYLDKAGLKKTKAR
jgi:hypothetical protein